MTSSPFSAPAAAGAAPSPPPEPVLRTAHRWTRAGARVCLLTLNAISGTSPRPLGAQMVVADDGRHAGQLSSGCVESTLIEIARQCLAGQRETDRLRVGAGGDFMDLQLPCGSSIEVHFETDPDPAELARADALIARRVPMRWLSGAGRGRADTAFGDAEGVSSRVLPAARVALYGDSPLGEQLAGHLRLAGCEVATIDTHQVLQTDPFCAVVTLWHDHDKELPVLRAVCEQPAFYIGCLGSRRSHRERMSQLAAMGVSAAAQSRLTAPAGAGLMSREPAHVALAIAMEVIARYEQTLQEWGAEALRLGGASLSRDGR